MDPFEASRRLLPAALKYSFQVFLGYITLGAAFGIFALERGYPWYVALATGVIMYAGAGQFIAVGLFAAGAPLLEAALIEFVVNARHMAYGVSMLRRFRDAGAFRPYLIFALSDETFALLSSLPEETDPARLKERGRLMFLVSLLDQLYWNGGILIGSLAGTLIPWNFEGVGFALTALFIVLMIEQILRVRRPAPFVISALVSAAAVFLLPGELSPRLSLLSAMVLSLGLVQLFEARRTAGTRAGPGGGAPC
ncbi:MAG: AzlC family ABC transporter permease [Treponema sp.]|jgi:4-azaleucine resistance transporter AzlC|nr:AzlC family ABC transporter permease [Treponema sp.]